MLINGPAIGSLHDGLGLSPAQQTKQAEENAKNRNTTTEAVSDAADSGGVKFDFSPSAITEAQESASQSQNSDETALAAYFYAAKWAQSLESAEPAAAGNGADKSYRIAAASYRHDAVIGSPNSHDGAVQPLQTPKTLGKF